MTRRAENDILTQTGPGTPMGELMRQYWMPALMSSELIADGDPVRFMLMSEKLIAFRDSSGRIGVMDHRCPHRCASLFFGRNEENGIRCVYHGWKFDVDGNCLDQANVPPHQNFKQKVKAKAYKAEERNGLVWVFMGDQENVPQLPPIEATLAPEDDVTITFIQRDCNWLQGAEGELDTSHLGVLHFGSVGEKSFEEDELNKYVVAERAPDYKAAETDYGFIYGAYRPADAGETYWRVGHFLFPVWTMPPIRSLDRNVMTRAYVPLDDEHCMIVIIVHKNAERAGAARADLIRRIPGASMRHDYIPNNTDWLGRWRLVPNRGNDYQIDREVQRNESFTGVDGIVLQDQMITESMGAITDRTLEHLAPSDIMITRTRRALLKAALRFRDGGELPASASAIGVYEGVRGGHFVAPENDDWLDAYAARVAASPLPASEAAE